MTTACRPCWRNCAIELDDEILAIDALEDRVAPVSADVAAVRELISCFELCHHKAERWVQCIIAAIAAGKTDKGLGTRPPDRQHPTESVWQNACAVLSQWCSGRPAATVDLTVGAVPAAELVAGLGERSPLKEWQVQRVIDKIRSVIGWAQEQDDAATRYDWLLLGGGEYEAEYRSECPECYKDHEYYWLATARTIIHDTESGDSADLSLALAIDMLWPCHWRFVENLRIVLSAIGGQLDAAAPFSACGRNITLYLNDDRMETICRTLRVFCGNEPPDADVDKDVLALLGEPTPTKRWLAASLAKTIRLQLYPTDNMRKISALTGPEWIK